MWIRALSYPTPRRLGSSFHEGSLEPGATICWPRPSWGEPPEGQVDGDKPAVCDEVVRRSILFLSMADPNEPQEDAVRLKPPDVKMRETVQMPLRDDRDAASTQFFRPANPSAAQVTPVSDSVRLEPRKETMRISSVAASSPVGTQIKTPQPFVPSPDLASGDPLVPVEPAKKSPMLLWWLLLGVSALILIIQIWTYLS